MTDINDKTRQTAHGLIQRYIGPDHKLIDMRACFRALAQVLKEAQG